MEILILFFLHYIVITVPILTIDHSNFTHARSILLHPEYPLDYYEDDCKSIILHG